MKKILLFCFFGLLTVPGNLSAQSGKIQPKHITVLEEIAKDLQSSGKTNQALKIYEIIIDVAPEKGGSNYSRAVLSARLGDFVQALEYYNQAVLVDPQNADKYYKCLLNLNACKL